MNLIPSKDTTRRALRSHSWLGIAIGAFMYLICLSGAIAVLYPEFERWEQPLVEEQLDYDIATIEQSYLDFLKTDFEESEHLFLVLPTTEIPRARITTDHDSFFLNKDGSRGIDEAFPWKEMLVNLHLYLHLPTSFGMIIVSLLGVLLASLIISGVMAHRRIFKDAFNLRWNKASLQQQTDLHNRLSVWGLPFHLMFGVTGAFFGLAALFSLLFANVYFNGDTQKVIETVYGEEPSLTQPVQPAQITKAIHHLKTIAPDAEPFYITLEEFNSPEQFMLIGAIHHDRLIYAEQYRYDSAGNYLGNVGYSDGAAGRQAIFSVYRLHFGHFGNFAVKVLYVLLGIALSIVSVTGINIWLAKRKNQDYINHLWTGIVWGAPLALWITAITEISVGFTGKGLFWSIMLVFCALTLWRKNHLNSKYWLLCANAVALFFIVIIHSVIYGSHAWIGGALIINIAFLISAFGFVLMLKPALVKLRYQQLAAA